MLGSCTGCPTLTNGPVEPNPDPQGEKKCKTADAMNSILKSIANTIGKRNGLDKAHKNNLLGNSKFFKDLDSYINPRDLIQNIVQHLNVREKDIDWAMLEQKLVGKNLDKIMGGGAGDKILPSKVKNLLDRTGNLILSKLLEQGQAPPSNFSSEIDKKTELWKGFREIERIKGVDSGSDIEFYADLLEAIDQAN
jgi:hypothetical protein